MSRRLLFISTILLQVFFTATAFGRGGGGCFLAGTPVRVPGGTAAIENLSVGDSVIVPAGAIEQTGTVCSVTSFEPGAALELVIGGRRLIVTGTHPFQVAPGVFIEAGFLKEGDTVCIRDKEKILTAAVDSIRPVQSAGRFHDILVMPGGIYVADGAIVHNKGCFLPDTLITRANGKTAPISEIKANCKILAFDKDGKIQPAVVLEVTTRSADGYLAVATDRATLNVTREHPFYVGEGVFKTIGALKTNDTIFAYDGSKLAAQKILEIKEIPGPVAVYNLKTDAPNTFFAGGIAVHNKGGCFLPDTLITKADGKQTRISEIKAGDLVLALCTCGAIEATAVREVTTRRADSYLAVSADHVSLNVTDEHPFYAGNGVFKAIGEFATNDMIYAHEGAKLAARKIRDIKKITGPVMVYNLKTDTPNTFFANGIAVHNKGGGCFPAGTVISTPGGRITIEQLKPGDIVLGVTPRGRTVETVVKDFHVTRSEILNVETEAGILRTTAGHPLLSLRGQFIDGGDITAGAKLAMATGRGKEFAQVQRTGLSGEAPVYNLTVNKPNTFIADGFIVHNKGGGGYHRSGSGGGGEGNPVVALLAVSFMAGMFIWVFVYSYRQKARENLDYVFSRGKIDLKAEKTRKLLEFIARVDQDFEPGKLTAMTKEVFFKLQECWQAREYEPMRPLMARDLFAEHERQLAAMKAQHEINKMEGLKVDAVDIVHVRYMNDPAQREFTALITATMRDYYVDDRDGKELRGDDSAATFQEFWTFHRHDNKWFLGEIEQTKESDALKEENFFEQFTKTGLEQVYGAAAGATGVAGPLLEKAVELKTNKIDRLLNFLAKTDSRMWNRKDMIERAREAFISVMLYEQTGNNSDLKESLIVPQVADEIRRKVSAKIAKGFLLELRNLCIRKVELVLVRNFADDKLDEYTARIRAHAQQITKLGGNVVKQDEDVTPFEEYWSFGRYGQEWKLKEILPPAAGEKSVGAENLDEDSSPEMLKWYYTQERAN
jgi:predicted lipid-binding transport protein (Tim44 family)